MDGRPLVNLDVCMHVLQTFYDTVETLSCASIDRRVEVQLVTGCKVRLPFCPFCCSQVFVVYNIGVSSLLSRLGSKQPIPGASSDVLDLENVWFCPSHAGMHTCIELDGRESK